MSKRKPEVTLRTAGGILYKATRRKVKNLNIRVHPDGTVAVSIPFRSSWEEADRFVLRHRDWVQEAQRDLADREARTYWRPLPEKDVALAHFAVMSDKVYPALPGCWAGRSHPEGAEHDEPLGRLHTGQAADHAGIGTLQHARSGTDLCGST